MYGLPRDLAATATGPNPTETEALSPFPEQTFSSDNTSRSDLLTKVIIGALVVAVGFVALLVGYKCARGFIKRRGKKKEGGEPTAEV